MFYIFSIIYLLFNVKYIATFMFSVCNTEVHIFTFKLRTFIDNKFKDI